MCSFSLLSGLDSSSSAWLVHTCPGRPPIASAASYLTSHQRFEQMGRVSSRQSPPRVLSPRGVCTRDARCLARGFSHIGFLAPSHSALTFRLRRRSPRRPFRPLLPTSGAFRLYSQSPLSPACHIALVGPSPARKSGKPRIEPVFSLLKPRPAVFL